MSIIKSPSDKSIYENIILKNGLEVVIVYDKDADTSAAAMSVDVGYYEDPDNFAGLAHFLEHMLFMGTKKYPDVSYYNEFINKHGGSTNAHTADEYTSYYCSVQSKYIKETLDIFGQFFIHPLFKKDTVNKEMQAVDSEHSKNIMSDGWRLNRVIGKTVNKNHPLSKFSTGNLDTLKHKNIREELIKFYKRYYSSDKMKLCVLSNIPIKDMLKIVTDIFSDVKKNPHAVKARSLPPVYNLLDINKSKKSVCYKLVKTVPIQDKENLFIIWAVPSTHQYFKSKPTHLLGHLLGHESSGSLISLLRQKQLAVQLNAGTILEDSSMSLFSVTVELTKDGFTKIPLIVDTIYAYIDLILKNLSKMVIYYDENKKINDIKFTYKSKVGCMSSALMISENLLKFPTKYCLSVDYIYSNYNDTTETLVKTYLKCLKRSTSVIIISSKQYDKTAIKVDEYYGVQYIDQSYPKSYGSEFTDAKININALHLPKANIFVPNKVTLLPKDPTLNIYTPIQLKNENLINTELWYKKDDLFKDPKVVISVSVSNDGLSKTVTNYVLFNLYISIVDYLLISFNYYAYLAGSYSSFYISYEMLTFNVTGYSNTIDKIINKVMTTFTNLKDIDENVLLTVFSTVKKKYEDTLRNYIYSTPVSLAIDYIKKKSYNRYYEFNDQLEVLRKLKVNTDNLSKIVNIMSTLKNSCRTKIFVGGNISKENAIKIAAYYTYFTPVGSQLIDSGMPIIKVSELKPGQTDIYKKKTLNSNEVDSAIAYFYEIGFIKKNVTKDWDKNIVLLILINTLISDKFFYQLRSVEQSGYIVNSKVYSIGSVENRLRGYLFMIQSYKKTPDDLQARIQLFVNSSYKNIKKISDKELQKYKDTLVSSLKEKDNNMYEHFNSLITEINLGDYLFNIKEILIKAVKSITKNDVSIFFKKYFIDKNTTKVRIVKVYSKNQSSFIDEGKSSKKKKIDKKKE